MEQVQRPRGRLEKQQGGRCVWNTVRGKERERGKQIPCGGPQAHSGPPQGGHHGSKRGPCGEGPAVHWAVLCRVLSCGLGHRAGVRLPCLVRGTSRLRSLGKGRQEIQQLLSDGAWIRAFTCWLLICLFLPQTPTYPSRPSSNVPSL